MSFYFVLFKIFDFDPDPPEMDPDPEPDPELSENFDLDPYPDPEIIFSAPTHWIAVISNVILLQLF